MRTYTTEHTVYNFDELSEEAKQKAIEKLTYINVDYSEWGNWILEDWKEELANMGFVDPDIAYSGFGSQGDGASFTGDIDIKKYIKANKLTKKYPALARAKETFERGIPFGHIARDKWHNYVHWNTTTVYLEGDNPTPAQAKELDTAYFQDISDEAIVETIKANEYEFYENGDIA